MDSEFQGADFNPHSEHPDVAEPDFGLGSLEYFRRDLRLETKDDRGWVVVVVVVVADMRRKGFRVRKQGHFFLG